MIIIKLTGGLGNQMFQYAAGRRLALMRDVQLKLDLSGFDATITGDTARTYALDVFRTNASPAQPEEISLLCKPVSGFLQRSIKMIAEGILSGNRRTYFKENSFNFDPEIMSLGENVYLEGFWQSERYFNDIRETIHQDFTIKQPLEGKNLELAEQIGNSGSVSLHVRRGDYVTNPVTGQYHGICSLDYYKQAIEYMAEKVSNPQLFIFSDDPAWVRENLQTSCPATVIDHNTPDKGYEDLRLMSLCRHNIIANSSFSWWGAWLNRNQGKHVVAPSKWFEQQDINTDDLIPSDWHRI